MLGLNVAPHLLSMCFLEQCGRKSARICVFSNRALSEAFLTWTSTRSSTSCNASGTSKPVISLRWNFSAMCLALVPRRLCSSVSLETRASSLKNDLDIFVRSKLKP